MRVVSWAAAAVVLVVMQTSLSPLWSVRQVTPDLPLAAVILAAVYGRGVAIFPFAVLLGWMEDLYAGGMAGISGAVYLLLAGFIRTERRRLDFDSYLLDLMTLAGTAIDMLAPCLVGLLAGGPRPDLAYLASRTAGRAVYTLAVVEGLRFLWRNVLEAWIASRPVPRQRTRVA